MHEEFDSINLKGKLDFKVWKKIFSYIAQYKKLIVFGVISIIATALLETLIIEYLSQAGIQRFVSSGAAFDQNAFILFVLGMAGLIVAEAIAVKIFITCCARLDLHMYENLARAEFKHLQGLSYSFFDKYSVGWLIARVTSDTGRLGEIISWGLNDIIWAFFKLIFILIFMMRYSVKLSLIMLIIVPIILAISIPFRRVVVKYFWKIRKINAQVTSSLNEGIMGATTSKSLVLEEKNLRNFSGLVKNYRSTSIRAAVFTSLYYQSVAIVAALGIALMCYYGGYEAYIGGIETGLLFMFISYTTMFFEPVLSIARISNQMKQAQVAAERVFNLLNVETEIPDTLEVIEKYGDYDNPKKENWEELNGDVEFKDVSFAYSGTNKTVLKNFNLRVKKGMTVALVGETGAGKSTIVNLLCRFYEPTSGTINIDGRCYKERSVGWLHANLGYVMQTPHLFSGTIKENIRYGNLEASDEEIIAAAKAANAHDFISKLDKGYDTEVGEGGSRLSQGQKQLVSFARAIVADPRILVLDEATSSIDTETEMVIQKAIGNILKGRTSFVIAHRLSTITNADLILVIKDGMLTEKGTHQELLALKGYYYKLYTNQFVEDKMKEMKIVS
ncbi:MAG: ABC transporter ATP-binding protein [Bacilli bacterium]|jgi:ATP-binding cassette subfamily B protein